jgi:hypothetical protein
LFENRIRNSKVDKGKLSERIGRKVLGLKQFYCYDSQTAGFFCFTSEVSDLKSRIKGGEIEGLKHVLRLS